MYNIIRFVHILAAMTAIGAQILFVGTLSKTLKAEGHAAANEVLRRFRWAENPVFGASAVLLLTTGTAMVIMSPVWGFSYLWIIITLILFVVLAILTGPVGMGINKELKALVEADEIESPEFGSTIQSYIRLHSWGGLLLLLIAVVMVFKPGS